MATQKNEPTGQRINQPLKQFTATLDAQAKTITFAVCVVMVIPVITIITQYTKLHDARLLIGPAVLFLLLIIAVLYRPSGYGLDAQALHVQRFAGAVRFPLRDVVGMMPVTAKELGFGIRALPVGGFLGYFGSYRYQQHGAVAQYVTDRGKMILITLADDRKIIISPDDTAGFVKAFTELKK